MTPCLRRTRRQAAAALLGGLLLTLMAGAPAARAQASSPSLLLLAAEMDAEAPALAAPRPAAPALTAFARRSERPSPAAKAKRLAPQGIQVARLAVPPASSGASLRTQNPEGAVEAETPYRAHAPPGGLDIDLGGAAEARLLLRYTLLPERGPRVSLFAEELPAKTDTGEALWRLIAKSGVSGGGTSEVRLIGEGEQLLALLPPLSPGEPPVLAARQELFHLSVERRAGTSAYGAAYRYEGPERSSLRKYGQWIQSSVKWRQDQESIEAWHVRKLGDTRLKFFTAEFWNNPEADPGRYRIESNQAGLKMDQRLGGTPLYLTLAAAQGMSSSQWAPPGREAFARAWNTYNAALSYYPDGRWDAYVSSAYSSAGDLSRTGDPGELRWHEAGLSIHPTWSTILKPVVALGKIRNARSREEIDYPFASLSLTFFDLLPKFEVTLYGSLARMTSREAALDTRAADAYLRLARRLNIPGPRRATLSLELGWSRYRDRLAPDRSSAGLSGMALLRFAY